MINENKKSIKVLSPISACILAVGIVAAAAVIMQGLVNFRGSERYVTVKGLAMKDVEANIASWSIKHVVTGNDLSALQVTIEANSGLIEKFLLNHGVPKDTKFFKTVDVQDRFALTYGQEAPVDQRYIVSETITVQTDKLDAVEGAYQDVGELIKKGVSIVKEGQEGSGNPIYIFTRLNEIKPEMIHAATINARSSAEQFAKDSGAEVGAIKQANQGVFQMLPRHSDEMYLEKFARYKTIRVVSTIKFYLK
ncbi:SIMPL domain-containing protein [Halodesulfovibrio aestuarii]|uniref:SIMPL domain-containing protein n=1 Tax=Halodesulfovibrio aestuarii TaxID=126333 RepID=UPI003D348C5A